MHLAVYDHYVSNGDGWLLHLRQAFSRETLRPERRPIVILPGYGMNARIFSYHPKGTSMERVFVEAGYEVWSVEMRDQGGSRPAPDAVAGEPSLLAYATIDLPAILDAAIARSETDQEQVTLLGCSLGGTIAYAYMALSPDNRVGAMIAMGSPLRWIRIHPFLRAALFSPKLIRMVPTRGSRRAAALGFPLAARIPGTLNLYMNTAHVEMKAAKELVQTVEDPPPVVNAEIARWFRNRDLILRGQNITEAVSQLHKPLLIVTSNRDGIVPPETARYPRYVWGSEDVTDIVVGTREDWYAHADLFIADQAKEHVFEPVLAWLEPRG